MHKFVHNLLTEWRKSDLPFADETIIVAVSGGADSVSLALALSDLKKRKKLNLNFVIAHFNHQLRSSQSRRDAEFVGDLAKKLDLEFIGTDAAGKFQISKTGNLEQNARTARYRFLVETAETQRALMILTAHTVNDQAETFLLNLLRGSGLAGLSAMNPKISNYEFESANPKSAIPTPKSQISLVRPLLNWATRADTENFCRDQQIEFQRDAMNDDLSFKRVRVRKILLPVLIEFNPKIIQTLAKTAGLLRIESEILHAAQTAVPDFRNPQLKLRELKSLSKSVLYRVLRDWLAAHRGNLRQLDRKHFEAVEGLIRSRKSGKMVELPDQGSVIKNCGRLIFVKKEVENIR